MSDFSAFYEIECIKRMDEDNLQSFKFVLENYASHLATRVELAGSAFTSHDQIHCLNIYKIISSVILRDDTAYTPKIGLTKRELYILNLAVLFHDIGMSDTLGAKRETHSRDSANYIQTEYDNVRSCLRSKANLMPNEVKAIKAIVKAHSDIKGDPTIDKNKNGLLSDELKKNYIDLHSKKIRTLFLAGVLRLADELDITSERLGNSLVETQIEEGKKKIEKYRREGNEEELRKWDGFLESEKHWKKLHLFEAVRLDSEKTKIELIIDDEYIEQKVDEGSTEKSLANDISDVYTKVLEEFSKIKNIAFSDSQVKIYIYAEAIEIVTLRPELEKEIQKAQSRLLLPVKDGFEIDESDKQKNEKTESNNSKSFPSVIDSSLEKEIKEEVEERQLLQFGHYLLNDKYCARNWLNIRELIETREISKKIVNSIVKHINSRDIDNVIILGMDMVGALLASRVAFLLQKPMSYIVSKRNREYNSRQDIDFNIKDNEKVILITESIATFKTVDDAIEKYELRGKVDSIYTVFYRSVNIDNEEKQKYIEQTFSLNNSFQIEVVEKKECTYKKCFANNRH